MKIAIGLRNGRVVEARAEEWVAALITTLPEHELAVLVERVEKKAVAYSTPGSHILHAEGGLLGLGK